MLISPELHILPLIVDEFLLRGDKLTENDHLLMVMILFKAMLGRAALAE
jgi:hypothetical protein